MAELNIIMDGTTFGREVKAGEELCSMCKLADFRTIQLWRASQQGPDISPADEKGQTFLHLAVLSRSSKTVAVLLDKGAVVSAQDLEGSTTLYLAANQGHREIINLLIDYGVEVGLVDKLGRIPFYRFARLGYGTATKLLVDRRLVVTTKDKMPDVWRPIWLKARTVRSRP